MVLATWYHYYACKYVVVILLLHVCVIINVLFKMRMVRAFVLYMHESLALLYKYGTLYNARHSLH